ncbi:rRNA methyltransferase 1, mitochondrial [Varanus komodoensis]|uniref:rRNA methyltransferase 1, mitochondrial n=1 Tax=Varanus komodoensis TaxID=61221 RepID=UPI001CF7BEC8|nr:rRNA methyltransferase 1, mitochondrial [Varanus komodoensis]
MREAGRSSPSSGRWKTSLQDTRIRISGVPALPFTAPPAGISESRSWKRAQGSEEMQRGAGRANPEKRLGLGLAGHVPCEGSAAQRTRGLGPGPASPPARAPRQAQQIRRGREREPRSCRVPCRRLRRLGQAASRGGSAPPRRRFSPCRKVQPPFLGGSPSRVVVAIKRRGRGSFTALERSRRSFFQMFLKAKRGSTSPAVEKFSQYAEERGIPVKMVRRTVLDLLCKHGVHQGVCLEVTPLRPIDWKDGLSDEVPCTESQSLWLALEGIKDPMNLGAVLRSAHFLGVDGIVMTRRNSCPLTPVVSKASSGAMEVLDVFHTADLQSFLKAKSEQGWEILGTTGHGKTEDGIPLVNSLDFCWTRPSVLVLGSEGDGLSPETRRLCHRMLTISPGRKLPPGIESLNVSVAAGILLHSICSQKKRHHEDLISIADTKA